jgi:uncharacterized protein
MAEHPNVTTIRASYAAFESGDLDALAATWTPEVSWHEAGNHPLAGDFKGREEIFALFGRLMTESGGTFRAELEDILVNDAGDVLALHRATGERNGKRYDAREALYCEMVDGKANVVRHLVPDLDEADAFWS